MDIDEIRLININHAIDKYCGGVRSELARRMGRDPSSIARWWLKSKHKRKVGYDSAREIETALSIKQGWIDQQHTEAEKEDDAIKRLELQLRDGETYKIPLHRQITIDQQLTVTFLTHLKGLVMLLSTDKDAYALKLTGHNPTLWLTDSWAIIVEPNTPLAINECALLQLDSGETQLRLIVHISDDLLIVRNPVNGEQRNLPRQHITRAEYAYIGIPPSKVVLTTD